MSYPAFMAAQSLTFGGVLSESNRIVKAQSRHFLALFFLIVLPLSFSVLGYHHLLQPTLVIPSYSQFISFFFSPEPEIPPIDQSDLINAALYGLFVLLFSFFATASITHSTYHGFHGKGVKLSSSLKSSLFSFFPLLVTYIASQLILGLVILAFGSFTALVFTSLSHFGVEIDYNNEYVSLYATLITILVVVFLIYFQVEWYVANAVVVIESGWGFAPLKRSSLLVKGMRRTAFTLMFFYGTMFGLWPAMFPRLFPGDYPDTWASFGWIIVHTIIFTFCMAVAMLYSVCGSTVLFMYGKALHGELVVEMEDEFEPEYASLSMDGEKAPKVVYVV